MMTKNVVWGLIATMLKPIWWNPIMEWIYICKYTYKYNTAHIYLLTVPFIFMSAYFLFGEVWCA